MLKYTIHQNDTQKHEVWNLLSLAWSQPADPDLVAGCRQECRFSQQCCRTQLPDPDRTFGCRHACLLSQPPLQNTAGQSNHWVGVRKYRCDNCTSFKIHLKFYFMNLTRRNNLYIKLPPFWLPENHFIIYHKYGPLCSSSWPLGLSSVLSTPFWIYLAVHIYHFTQK